MKKKEYSIEIGGKLLIAIFNDLADQANGSVMLKYGDTVILATAVMGENDKTALGYFPLTVDYEERFYAAGEILGSRFVRREGRPSEEAILAGRVVDRTIRPLFESYIRRDIQVVITVLSLGEDDPDILGIIGASLALGVSNIPWNGPVSAVRIGRQKGSPSFETNPSFLSRKTALYELDLIACGKDGNINMIEVGSKEISETDAMLALTTASEEIEKIQIFQKKIIAELGKKKTIIPKKEIPSEIIALFAENIAGKMVEYIFTGPGHDSINALKETWLVLVKEKAVDHIAFADDYFEDKVNETLHAEAINNNRRADGRSMDEVRPLYAEAGGISPILHGSGIFYRGGTHILSVLTLGGPEDALFIDSMESREEKRRFMHQYNFPPFSTGETGRLGGMNRRMIGHGALAEKALLAVIPAKEKFPYTIRIVSEAMASNGSTSMGSVCGSTLALMDAGVPISAPVAGIASGLMMESPTKFKVLTDIQGPEDHHGDMDFKVAGTKNGVTAVQMDVKVNGIPLPILEIAFEKARLARLHILKTLEAAISEPRADISPKAPKILIAHVKKDQIGLIIGTGGKTINEIREKTLVDGIDIEEDGTVYITGKNGSAEKAKAIIEDMTREYKPGEQFKGEITKITDFGAFVKLGSGTTEGLVHVSEIAPWRVERVSDILKEGQIVPVIVKEIDERGRIKLSIKDIDPKFAGEPPARPAGPRPFSGGLPPQGPRTNGR